MSRQLRVGVTAKVFIDWSGGIDFIAYVANALASDEKFKVLFLIPSDHRSLDLRINSKNDLALLMPTLRERLLGGVKDKKPSPNYKTGEITKNLNKNIELICYRNNPKSFLACLKSNRIDLVLPTTTSFGKFFPIPWVGYIWDFQHKYYPNYFSDGEIEGRNVIFKRTLTEAPAIIVNSLTTKLDAKKFFGTIYSAKKIFNLPFAPYPSEAWLKADTSKVIKKYKLPKKYFIVSNQFWMHKAHGTAIEAMSRVIKKDPTIHLLCTGKMEEPRKPEYIDLLKNKVKNLGLIKNVHLLGFIPKEDQVALLKGALALVQPTLYEGGPGGGAAYNAIALGVPVIASDIPINLEMKNEDVIFFKAESAKDLADKMLGIAASGKRVQPSAAILRKNGEKRLNGLASVLSKAVLFATDNYKYGAKQ